YARVRRTYADFAARVGMEARAIAPRDAGVASTGARGFVDAAVDAVEEADAILSELQDSMLPVEVGDQELRAGLSAVRELLGQVPGRARALVRVLGRCAPRALPPPSMRTCVRVEASQGDHPRGPRRVLRLRGAARRPAAARAAGHR